MAKKSKDKQSHRLEISIASLIVIAITIIAFFKLGIVGILIDKSFRFLFGEYHFVTYLLLILTSLMVLLAYGKIKLSKPNILGYSILFLGFLLFSALVNNHDYVGGKAISFFFANSSNIFNYRMNASGGMLGILVYGFFTMLFDYVGTIIVLLIIVLIGILLTVDIRKWIDKLNASIEASKLKRKKKVAKKKHQDEYQIGDEYLAEHNKTEVVKAKKSAFITLKDDPKGIDQITLPLDEDKVVTSKGYKLPRLTLLDTQVVSQISSKNKNAAEVKGKKLVEVLSEFNITAELVDTHIGPSVTKFELRPDSSVKVSRISAIQDNIKMELAAKNIRIEAPIPGKNTVGVEIPNIENTTVKLYELLRGMPQEYVDNPLLFALGKDLMGNTQYCDLTKMPHLLIAGATGAGKSVAMNAIITTILIRTTPDQVRLLLIDPKKVEFTSFSHVPHLLTDIISEPQKANNALAKVVEIMDDRYRAFAEIGVKNITAYNEYKIVNPDKDLKSLELIVVIIDELADLMIVAGKEVEQSIQRITQLARAAGIHLIVATQRPSTDVITGIIKANIPSRISFAVSSGIDSRTILDAVGAERLLGNGDMLYYPVTYSAPSRLQGVYVSDDEVSRIAEFVSKQPSPDHLDVFENLDEEENTSLMPMAFDDPLYEDVKQFVVKEKKASTSLIQRSFGIGYNRAARIIDALEAKDVIGPMQGSKPRDVYLDEEDL